MFRPLPMKHLRLHLLADDLPRASLLLAELGVFSPDARPPSDEEGLDDAPGARYTLIFNEASSRLDKIRRHLPTLSAPELSGDLREVSRDELSHLNNRLREIWRLFSTLEEDLRQLREEERLITQLEQALENFKHIKADLGLLREERRFLDVHVGVVPRYNLTQLESSLTLTGSLLFVYHQNEEHGSVVVVGPRGEREGEVRAMLDTAGFTPLSIPVELRAEPTKVKAGLVERRDEVSRKRDELQGAIQAAGREHQALLVDAARLLALAAPLVTLDHALRGRGQLASLQGWAPAREIERIQATLDERLGHPYVMETRDPRPDECLDAPTAMPQNRLAAPFVSLVKQFGVPRYGEFDPSLLFGLSFVLLFGMMFGDLGHGAVFVVVGLAMRRRLGRFLPFILLNGLSSMGFGVLYGSVFGFEGLFHPVWIAPLTDPIYMLTVALGIGVAFILLVSAINIRNQFAAGDREAALFGANSVAGVALYLGLLTGLYRVAQGLGFGIAPTIVVGLSLAALLAYRLIEIHAPLGERIVVALVETFETVTGYFSNTLSFLRVAAFSLNHVALAVAVFTLAEMMGPVGHWSTVVLGNVFILVLEGLIVMIQTLRLEYYEGFSRFFSGDGKEFVPLTLRRG